MSDESPKKDILKQNTIRLADDHRKTCKNSDCGISIMMLAELLHLAGIELDEHELRHFL